MTELNHKEMATRVERINPNLNVADVAESVAYYVNVLGFDPYVETPTLGIVERDGHQIHLRKSVSGDVPVQVWIGVEDTAILFEQYKAKGARIRQEPANYSWAFQMVIEDLDGNLLAFGSGPLEGVPYQD
jgi:catechol 2,3-dioxygenase-like lactoylglutathione lyase family enzyme